ncbi:fumarylacetoacetate hydrolase family protein [Ruegeria sp. HKCCD8929]|uniref:fumarylacetoacetate hydrolase family protein n=1 Tax=Ruegeria sp. HKCCD8929 TaxID=2683006 RepID=UPI0014886539|nr:fumarylacetoacetate hydrolase family protein [Ruegeria sp. HKCCD8929]
MKLVRFGSPGQEKPGIVDEEGNIRDLSAVVADISGDALSDTALEKIRSADVSSLPVVEEGARLGACVAGIGKFLCIGLNYSDHAKEANMPIPEEPIMFMKATSAVVGAYDDVIIPKDSQKSDWEVELGVVIGKTARHVSEADALSHVAGYCVVNDLSEREFQIERGGQWVKGKSCDTFGPIGPWLVTRDEVPDPQALSMWLEVDGVRYQNGSTSTMIFGVAELISYCSRFMTLEPGDVISTGTPPGVGMGHKPDPVFLKAGQKIRLSVEGLGEQQQNTVAYS